jgi:hypothetical protein
MTDEIDIPASARDIKAIFPTRPSDEVVAEIKAYVKISGTPYLWSGHTHSPPAEDAEIVYLDEISLPTSHCGEINREKWSPCPVCSPRHPKFYKAGMIAWFPVEKTIRIIGPECFASFNFEAHSVAYDAFRRDQEEKKNEAFLLSHLDHIGEVIDVIDASISTAKEVDRVREILARRIPFLIDFDLWNHVRAEQQLSTYSERRTTVRDRNGEEREVIVRGANVYGPIIGHTMLEPKAKLNWNRLDVCRTRLKMIAFGEKFAEYLASISPEEKRKLARHLQKEVRKARDLFDELNEVRRFLRPENVSTLRGWGKHEDCPTKFYIAFEPDGRQLRLGRTNQNFQSMTVREPFWETLRQIPILSDHRQAAQ